MKAIVVDDEKLALDFLLNQIRKVHVINKVVGFINPIEALEYAKNNYIDIAFLDIEMYYIKGIEMAKRLKDIIPSISIVFITGHSIFAADAFKIRANGYLLKPVFAEDIEKEIKNILAGVKPKSSKRIVVKTFGNFDVFVNDQPVVFKRTKSKELLAFLVDRKGSFVSNGQAIANLWEERTNDRGTNSLYRTVLANLFATLKSINAEHILVKKRNQLAIDTTKIECDYYQFIKGDISAINQYTGEYMLNYSWAEFTTAVLSEKANKA